MKLWRGKGDGREMTVVIMGASANPKRYAHKAQTMLMEQGHVPIPISLSGDPILGVAGYSAIEGIPDEERPVDTVTVYLRPERFSGMKNEVKRLSPRRVIFNPGTEDPILAEDFRQEGIEVVEACTLVLLSLGQF
ncbi:MAG: CoA-binding protein [Verrucomicrobiota bacterium]